MGNLILQAVGGILLLFGLVGSLAEAGAGMTPDPTALLFTVAGVGVFVAGLKLGKGRRSGR